MEDTERRELLSEISKLKSSLDGKRVETKHKSAEEIIRDMRLYGDVPKDQYAHQFRLLFHPQSAPNSQMDLLPADALLGIVKDSKSLMFLQNDNAILNRLYDMGNRCGGVMDLFNSLFYSWWQQMRMTGILGGNERLLQSFNEPSAIPYEGFTFMEKRAAKKQAKKVNYQDIIKRIGDNQRNRQYI